MNTLAIKENKSMDRKMSDLAFETRQLKRRWAAWAAFQVVIGLGIFGGAWYVFFKLLGIW